MSNDITIHKPISALVPENSFNSSPNTKGRIKKYSKVEDIPDLELARLVADYSKKWVRRKAEKVYPPELEPLEREFKRRRDSRDKKIELEISDADTKLSLNRLERAKADLASRGQEPLPNHHCINHE